MRLVTLMGAWLLAASMSCQAPQNSPPAQPDSSPTTPPGPVETLDEQEPGWVEIISEMKCTPPGNEPLCMDGYFRVNNNGQFYRDANGKRGSIDSDELKGLSDQASVISVEALRLSPRCDGPSVFIPEIAYQGVQMTLSTGETIKVLDGTCYRGQLKEAQNLFQYMKKLSQKYGT